MVVVALALALAACAKGPAAPSDSGVQGQALLGPQCPVETVESPCPDKPIEADIKILQNGDEVTTVHSGSDGSFSVALAPGDYVLLGVTGGDSHYPSAKPVNVTVRAHDLPQANVMFDTGIR